MDDFELILKNEFLDEAAQSLESAEQCFLLLENDPSNVDNLNKIFRLAHNLKGSSKAVGFLDMSAFTHEFETFILKLKNGELQWSQPVVNLLLASNDHLIQMVQALKQDHSAKVDSSDLLTQMEYLKDHGNEIANQSSQEQPEESKTEEAQSETIVTAHSSAKEAQNFNTKVAATENKVEIEPNLDLLQELLSGLTITSGTSTPADSVVTTPKIEFSEEVSKKADAPLESLVDLQMKQVVSDSNVVSTSVSKNAVNGLQQNVAQPMAASQSGTAASSGAAVEESMRISVSKLEMLLNYVGEMVILQTVLREQANQSTHLLLRKTVQQLGKVGKEIQDLSMSLRMVPVRPTFQKMQRIVRDTAQMVQKDVGIILQGEDTELDKTVLEKINDPLVHLIRNSVDHGIEKAEDRLKKGKPKKGTVTLAAYHRSGKLIIDVKDDGAGLDAEKLKKKAVEKGIIKADASLTEKEAFNLIFAPGFSTKEQVTEVSGRGVGMDVVKTNIHDLSGEIQIFSEKDKGTTFQIILPLTLAIIDGMVITFADEKYVVPLNQIFETLRPTDKQVQYNQGLGFTLMLRGENIPVFRLGDFFSKQSKQQTSDMIALVIRSGSRPFALLVDDIIGQFQVVTKRLGPELQGLKGVSGSTILGDGRPALILEPQDLLKRNKTNLGPAISSNGGKAA